MFVHLKEGYCLMSVSAGICLWAFGRKDGQSAHPHGGNMGNTTYTIDIGDTDTFMVLGEVRHR